MLTISLEAWSTEQVVLTSDQAENLGKTQLASVAVGPSPGTWSISTESKVGIVSGPGWELRVEPKLSIPNLMFLLGYASSFGWKNEGAEFEADSDLFGAVASGFAFHALQAIEPSPLRGYTEISEESQSLRGRLQISEQMSRSSGLPIPLQIAYDDYTPDIIENRLLKTAAGLLLRFSRIPTKTASTLRRIRAALEAVGSLAVPYRAELPTTTRLNQHYQPALALAHLILRDASISTREGRVASIGFTFDMNKVFEDFLSIALRDALRSIGGVVGFQFSKQFLDHEDRLRLKPDITWWNDGRCAAVVDAKYKRLTDSRFPNADANQMFAYCTAFGLSDGFLVYARDAQDERRLHRIRNGDVRIHVETVDVERNPEEVLAQVDRLSDRISQTAKVTNEVERAPAAGGADRASN